MTVKKLPVERGGIDKRWIMQKFLMIGPSGIGKSAFWSHAKNPFYIEAEQGLNYIDVCKQTCNNWDDVADTMNLLLEAAEDPNTFPYDVVVVDTIDEVLTYTEEEVMCWAKMKYRKGEDYTSVGDIPEGAGWYMREKFIKKILKGLKVLPCAKVLIGHVETKRIKGDGVPEYDKLTINIGGKVGGGLLAWPDHTLNVTAKMMGDRQQRVVYTKPLQSRECKSRGSVIKDCWMWDKDDKVNFEQLRKQFD